MKLKELLKDIEVVELAASSDAEINGISYDSRKTKQGDAFVAITGFETDGYAYIPSAAQKGAAVVICEKKPQVDIPYVIVADCRYALAILSRNYFGDPASEMTVIGITGTNGKTTTTYLLKHLLEAKLDAKVGLVGTNGNMIGDEFIHTERTTPESYELQQLFREMADAGCTHVVMEVSSHSLVLHRVAGIHFAVGAFTNLTQDHLDFHHTMDEYAKAKAMLFTMCETGCVNVDDKWHDIMLDHASCKLVTYSAENNSATLVAKDVRLSASGVEFCAVTENALSHVKLAIPGKFSVYNALGVIAVGLALGISLDDCADAMGSAKGVKGRMEVVPTDGDYTIVIDYAHTPDALENVLNAIHEVLDGKGNVITVCGAGGNRDKGKRPIMAREAAERSDRVVITSDNPRFEEPEAIIADMMAGVSEELRPKVLCITDRREAIRAAAMMAEKGDIILVAGKGHEPYQDVKGVKHHFDDHEEIRKAFGI